VKGFATSVGWAARVRTEIIVSASARRLVCPRDFVAEAWAEENRRFRIGGYAFRNLMFYFELLAARREGGTMPRSGISLSILSERWCSGLSPAEDSCGPALTGAVRPCAVYVASLKVVPDLAAATANTPCGTPSVKAVAM